MFIYILSTFNNVTESTLKRVTLVKKNVCVKIPLHACIRARKAALVWNYFSRCNNFFCLNMSELSTPSNFDVSYTVSIACFNTSGSEWGLKMQSEINLSIHMVTF